MIAVIVGASGLTGSKLLELLLKDSDITKVISMGRRPLPVKSTKLSEVLVGDLADLHSVEPQLRGDIYFCCLGTTIKTAGSQEAFRKVDYQAVADFGKIAKANGAKSFVLVSAAGANQNSKIFYNRVKGETEEFLKGLGLKSLVFARPGLLMGDRKQRRTGEAFAISAMRVLSPVLPGALRNRMATDVDRLAEILLREGKRAEAGARVLPASELV